MNNNDKNNKNKKEFNTSLARAYQTKQGAWSPPLSQTEYETAVATLEAGGRIVFRRLNSKKNEKSPDGYFDFISAKKVEEMRAAFAETKKIQTSKDSDLDDDL